MTRKERKDYKGYQMERTLEKVIADYKYYINDICMWYKAYTDSTTAKEDKQFILEEMTNSNDYFDILTEVLGERLQRLIMH